MSKTGENLFPESLFRPSGKRFSNTKFRVSRLWERWRTAQGRPPKPERLLQVDLGASSFELSLDLFRVGLGNIHPRPNSTVRVLYWGWTKDGQLFDSTDDHGGPVEFPLDQVIDGWKEGLQLMVKGEKRRFWIPGHLAYDTDPRPEVPKGQLTFDIELIDFR